MTESNHSRKTRITRWGIFKKQASRWQMGLVPLLLLLTACAETSTSAAEKKIEGQLAPSLKYYGPPAQVPADARNAVISAYAAMQAKNWALLPALAQQARADQELGEYPMFWYLRNQIRSRSEPIPAADILAFLEKSQNPYLHERLKADWILEAARTRDFATVRKLGNVNLDNAQVDCAVLHARHMGNGRVSASQAMDAFRPGTACWDMMAQLYASKVLQWDHIQPLLRDDIEYDNKANARRYAAMLFSPAQMKDYDAFMVNPKAWLSGQSGKAQSREQEELRTLAFSRLARQDREDGYAFLQRTGNTLVSAENRQWILTQFGLVSVLNLEDRADQWYRQAGEGFRLSEYNHAWRVRAALRQPNIDWPWVAKAIGMMPPAQQQEPVWIYWKARAWQAMGNTSAARKGFETVANEDHGFYGQLATEALGRKIMLPPQAPASTSAELAHVRQNRGLQRAVSLFNLGWRPEAVAEWNFAIKGLNDRELIAAAEWAEQENIYDRAINTSLLTQGDINFRQRFLAPFEGKVGQQARNVGLDPAWVYGLIRQESRFVPVARSRVGAAGLMQVMPGTAKMVAKKIGMSDFSMSDVNEFDTNTRLGTSYLSMVKSDLGNSEILATAGYNAGPNRSKRWRSSLSGPVEGAIFAETIPFTETRLYVKHVMSNATWYATLFSGQPQSLVQRLGTVTP
ncbi:lytic transglycosylase domain-containing protein [Advenella alkanexedens]|uniref:lytic transglycosylase domain-containing protein n=1 Tax=Advenella alkanexedens TaxID=1481665 RepID=UPI00267468BE|nr:lytic transglycosylase domain-containing protein [Advenella alkanexedens]WKU19368.1 transglycosylase SLT domain-containing protein [Advenella alkanexedens]